MINVVCVWVRGNVPYSAEYVTRLRNMVRRNLSAEHRFVCFTDRALSVSELDALEMETRSIEPHPGLPGWWSKIEIFNPRHGLRGRSLYLDLDTLVVSPIDDIARYPSRFALVPTAGNWKGRDGLKVVPRYNSSVMVWDEGLEANTLYSTWSPKEGRRLWGDQDWIGEQLPDLDTMPLSWFPRLSELSVESRSPIPLGAKVILCKKPKNHEAAERWSWVSDLWR